MLKNDIYEHHFLWGGKGRGQLNVGQYFNIGLYSCNTWVCNFHNELIFSLKYKSEKFNQSGKHIVAENIHPPNICKAASFLFIYLF